MVQLPALDTPQFSWVKSRLPRKPQPVPPIFQPEVAAEAIVWAAHHDRPEIYVGWQTVKAIVGNKIAPRFADWYLARAGYNAQQTDEPVEAGNRSPAIMAHTAISMRGRVIGVPSSGRRRIENGSHWRGFS